MNILVTNTNDHGEGSLRQAILDANATPGADTITFDPNVRDIIRLTSGELTITDALTIRGSDEFYSSGGIYGSQDLSERSRIFNIDDSTETQIDVTIENLRFLGGDTREDNSDGAGVWNRENLTLRNIQLSNNQAANGAAIRNDGTLLVSRSSIHDNYVYIFNPEAAGTIIKNGGGAILNTEGAIATIDSSFLSGNIAPTGGAIQNNGQLIIRNSTLANNSASSPFGSAVGMGLGGAIFNTGGNATILNSTITDNTAAHDGGGIYNTSQAVTAVTSTIIAGNSDDNDIGGAAFTSNGNNLIGNGSGTAGFTNGINEDIVGNAINPIDPRLGDFWYETSLSSTVYLPEDDSPAVDAGSNPDGLIYDQRGEGFPRSLLSGIDIGAAELSPTIVKISASITDTSELYTEPYFYVSLSQPRNTDTIVNYNIAGTATNGIDYVPIRPSAPELSGSITIPANSTGRSIRISVLNDAIIEGNETIVLTLDSISSSGAFTTVDATPAVVNIVDNDTGRRGIFEISTGDVLTIDNFRGVGRFDNPDLLTNNEIDTLVFSGTGLTAANLLLIQEEDDLIVSFAVSDSPQVTLTNFDLDDFDNLTINNQVIANIQFDDETSPSDSINVLETVVWNHANIDRSNIATFLSEGSDRLIKGTPGPDFINGQGSPEEISFSDWGDEIFGKQGDDVIRGGSGSDHLGGGKGNDLLVGGGRHDYLWGKADDDSLHGGDGNDFLHGGGGDDTLHGGNGNDYLEGDYGNNVFNEHILLFNEDGNDILLGEAGDDILHAWGGDDILNGGTGNDTLYGNFDSDQLTGEAGNDLLSGGQGADFLNGGDGDDLLSGGLKADILTGGTGNDTFRYLFLEQSLLEDESSNTYDIITDLTIGTDRIDSVNAVSASNVIQAGNVANLDEAGIQMELTIESFAVNAAATFTVGSRTFLALNDSTAGYQQNSDALIEITGYTGDLANLEIA